MLDPAGLPDLHSYPGLAVPQPTYHSQLQQPLSSTEQYLHDLVLLGQLFPQAPADTLAAHRRAQC